MSKKYFYFNRDCLDPIQVCRDPRWGRCYESYSEDHKIVQQMTELIPGLQGEIPANSTKGVPYVAGKYVSTTDHHVNHIFIACYLKNHLLFQKSILFQCIERVCHFSEKFKAHLKL